MEVETLTVWCPSHQGEKLSTGFFHRKIHYSDDADKDSNWVVSESPKYQGVNSARWRREMEVDWEVYGGQRVWPMLSRKYHNAIMDLNADWAIFRVIDHGIRHPTCCLWCGVNRNGDRHFFREYYATDRSVAVNCKQIMTLSAEDIVMTFIDPSTRERVNYLTSDVSADKQGFARLIDLYEENGIICSLADNSAVGYDKVTDGLLSSLARSALRVGDMPVYLVEMGINQEQLLMLASKPAITFDLRFVNRAFNETENLRWKELTGDSSQHSEPEKTVDVKDEGPDCVRYATQSDLFWRRPEKKIARGSVSYSVMKKFLRRKNKEYKPWM